MLDVITKMYSNYSIALVGCRFEGINYECCEYDLIILDAKEGIVKVDDQYLEIHNLSNNKMQMMLQLYNSKIIQDPSLRLVALKQSIDASILKMHAKNLLIDALLDANDAEHASNPLETSFLLKRAAYRYMNALLELNMIKPSPLHILQQLKGLEVDISLALECLGTSQANSSSINRALHILEDLPNYMLLKRKISYLYDRYRYVDCYIYITHLAMLLADEHKISDNLRILLNLAIDDTNRRLARALFNECKIRLRNIKY